MNSKIIIAAGLFTLVALLFGFRQKTQTENTQVKRGMIKVTILYPNGEGKKFDMDYYSSKHMPMIASLLGDSLKRYEIDKGIAGRTSSDPIPYLAIGYLYFDKLSAFQNSFKPHAEKIRGDVMNYTNIQPIIQISEVLH
ncbi:MAG TPA: EthD family reductase [Cyclobacteriaceae bacterium]